MSESSIEPLMTVRDVMQTLRVGRTKINYLMRDRVLQRVKVGSRTLVTSESVRAFIAGLKG